MSRAEIFCRFVKEKNIDQKTVPRIGMNIIAYKSFACFSYRYFILINVISKLYEALSSPT